VRSPHTESFQFRKPAIRRLLTYAKTAAHANAKVWKPQGRFVMTTSRQTRLPLLSVFPARKDCLNVRTQQIDEQGSRDGDTESAFFLPPSQFALILCKKRAVSLAPIPYPASALTGEHKAAILANHDWPASRTPHR
jgi:hypothetical protein